MSTAVVLVGGEGTRLRPLTDTIPKPLIPLVDRPILAHVLDHLGRHGVGRAIASSAYLERTFHAFIEERRTEPRIEWITEAEPLGTGGAVVNAVAGLPGDDPVFALNGDILTDLDLTEMLAFHRERGAVATIALAHVEDARPFGLVPVERDGRVVEFREKPAELVPGDVNAGTYVLEPAALEGWERGVNVSIERDVFPKMIADGLPVYGFRAAGTYWIDLGTPEQYLQATFDLLGGAVRDAHAYAEPFVDERAEVDPGAALDGAVVGPGARVGAGATVSRSVLLEGAGVSAGALVRGSILGPGSTVSGQAVDSVLGQGAVVGPGVAVRDARVPPGENVER